MLRKRFERAERGRYSAARIAARVAELSKEISRELEGRRLDVRVTRYRGVTRDFLLRRLGEGRWCSFRPAVLLDKPGKRRLAREPDYFAFRTASNGVWVRVRLGRPQWHGEKSATAFFGNEQFIPEEWKRTRKESMIEAVRGGFRNQRGKREF